MYRYTVHNLVQMWHSDLLNLLSPYPHCVLFPVLYSTSYKILLHFAFQVLGWCINLNKSNIYFQSKVCSKYPWIDCLPTTHHSPCCTFQVSSQLPLVHAVPHSLQNITLHFTDPHQLYLYQLHLLHQFLFLYSYCFMIHIPNLCLFFF